MRTIVSDRTELNRHSPDTNPVGADLPSLAVSRQRNSIATAFVRSQTLKCKPAPDPFEPVLTATNIHYEIGERVPRITIYVDGVPPLHRHTTHLS
jgi:hypothetical protein